MNFKIILSALLYAVCCYAADISITGWPTASTITPGTNIALEAIYLTASDTSVDHGNLVCTVDYIPTGRFVTDLSKDGDGPGYAWFGRMQDFSLFSDWSLVNEAGAVVAFGQLTPPGYPDQIMARVAFTNVPISWGNMNSALFYVHATLVNNLTTDIARGFITDDEVGVFPSAYESSVWSENQTNVIVQGSWIYPPNDVTVQRPKYSTVTSVTQIGDDMVVRAYVEPGQNYVLQATFDPRGAGWFDIVDTVESSSTGEIFFMAPKITSPGASFFRLMSVDSIYSVDSPSVSLVLFGETNGPSIQKPGVVSVTANITSPPNIGAFVDHWLTDTGEVGGQNSTFSPTFGLGVHWVKCFVRGAATEAPAFRWIIVRD